MTVVQSVERQIVILVVVGSIPIGHPILILMEPLAPMNIEAQFNPLGFFIFII